MELIPVVVLLAIPAAICVTVGVLLIVTGVRSRARTKQLVGIALLVVASLLVWRIVASEFWAENNCLDAGGRYDHASSLCVYD